MNAFVFQHRGTGKFFGVRGFDTQLMDNRDDPEVVVFRPNYRGTGKRSDFQTGWHAELAVKLSRDYRRVEVNR